MVFVKNPLSVTGNCLPVDQTEHSWCPLQQWCMFFFDIGWLLIVKIWLQLSCSHELCVTVSTNGRKKHSMSYGERERERRGMSLVWYASVVRHCLALGSPSWWMFFQPNSLVQFGGDYERNTEFMVLEEDNWIWDFFSHWKPNLKQT